MSIETFEDLAKKITYDRMLHFGYTPEQIAEAEAEDHSRCDWNADERNCLGEDEKSLHPIADELDATAESVVWVLEYVMRPVAEIRARLSEVEAERDAARAETEHVRQRARWAAIYRANGRCRTCSGFEDKHRMSCRHYVGPLEHIWEEWQARINPTFGGTDHYCRCGGSCRVGGLAGAIESGPPVCPTADQTYRGVADA